MFASLNCLCNTHLQSPNLLLEGHLNHLKPRFDNAFSTAYDALQAMANKIASSGPRAYRRKCGFQPRGKGAVRTLKSHGFTLLELLVVIAIVALLAAILLSALSRAKAQANSTACKNHLHQMELGLQMYLDDNANKFPYLFLISNGVVVGSVFSALHPYYPLWWTNASYHCPGYKAPITDVSATWPEFTGSYAYNIMGTFLEGGGATYPSTGVSLGLAPFIPIGAQYEISQPPIDYSVIRVPSEMFAFGESRLIIYPDVTGSRELVPQGWPSAGQPLAGAGPMLCGAGKYWPAYSYPARHGKNYNVTYCDGHVESLAPGILFDPTRTAARWNNDHEPHPETWLPLTP
jgi:prepilin-type N-terminal cleavage/methylation domain-containing protein/prepilin-type processing-associated H-X9-DG protein